MNMAVTIELDERVRKPHGSRENGPETAKGRLYEWSRHRGLLMPSAGIPSPAYTIFREQCNAGARATGIRYEMLDDVEVPPDGGLGEFCDRYQPAVEIVMRVRQVTEGLRSMPTAMQMVALTMYGVIPGERVRSDRYVADQLKMARLEVIKTMERAYGWMGRELGLPPA